MHKRLVVNIFHHCCWGCAYSAPVYAAEKTVVNISKVDGMPWFNRMGEGVVGPGKSLTSTPPGRAVQHRCAAAGENY